MCPKIDSCSAWRCAGGAVTIFPSKLRLNLIFRPGGLQVHPLHPLATPMLKVYVRLLTYLLTESSELERVSWSVSLSRMLIHVRVMRWCGGQAANIDLM